MNAGRIVALLFGFILLASCHAENQRSDWFLYQQNEYGRHYYDRGSTKKVSSGVFRVLVKQEMLPKGVELLKKRLGERYREGAYSILLEEINCAERKYRIVKGTFYEKSGLILDSIEEEKGRERWKDADAETVTRSLLRYICK